MIEPFELAINGAVARALRRRAALLRKNAAPGVTVLDGCRRRRGVPDLEAKGAP